MDSPWWISIINVIKMKIQVISPDENIRANVISKIDLNDIKEVVISVLKIGDDRIIKAGVIPFEKGVNNETISDSNYSRDRSGKSPESICNCRRENTPN